MEEDVKAEETKDETEAVKEEEKANEKPLDKMTSPELREVAKAIPGVFGVHAMKKDELLAVIKESRGIKGEEPPKKTKTKKPALSAKELKLKIARLREEKGKARESKNKKDVDTLRRRINRMKKQTRKTAQA